MSSILVTGANGLLGRAVCAQLFAAGQPFVAVDVVAAQEDGIEVLAADVRDVHRLYALADQKGPFDAIIHCGALSGPMLARDNPMLLHDINITGTVNILELARLKAARRVVLCSSVSAYGNTPEGLSLVPEEVPLRPTTVYGASKAAGEALANGYLMQHGVDSISLRIAWVYGPRRTTDCNIRDMVEAGLAGEPYRRTNGAELMRQYVHVDDVAAALILAAHLEEVSQRAYTITGASFLSLPEVADLVRCHLPDLVTEIGPGPDPQEDVQAEFDIAAAAAGLGYRPSVSLVDGIGRYVDWLKAKS